METSAIASHGASSLLIDRLVDSSDVILLSVCSKCSNEAIQESKSKKMSSSSFILKVRIQNLFVCFAKILKMYKPSRLQKLSVF
jgi:DNA-directed RNA polymerase beta subunit